MMTKNNKREYLENMRTLLITVNMQKEFLDSEKSVNRRIRDLIENQREIINLTRFKENSGIAFVSDFHRSDAVEFKRCNPHCLGLTENQKIIDELQSLVKDSLYYTKNCSNFMLSHRWENDFYEFEKDLLHFKRLECVYIMGGFLETDILNGALSIKTFFDDCDKDVDVCVVKPCVYAYSSSEHSEEELNEYTLKLMELNGIRTSKWTV